ncbi:hypothetical protein TNCV_3337311 [Trichonephila clavipes]|nr:hypothetical protein TNCV_3337311 [Trichonephila clavipes]
MAAQPISLDVGLLCQYRMQVDDERSFQIRMWTLEYRSQYHDSPEKTTLCHSCIQLCHLAYQCRHVCLCCIVKGSRSNCRLTDSPSYCKRFRTL